MLEGARLVAGRGRFDTEILTRFPGDVSLKAGAEGVYCGGIRSRGIGFAVKIEDGAKRAAETAEIGSPSDHDAGRWRILDRVARNGRVRFHRDAEAPLVDRFGFAAKKITDHIALDRRQSAAVIEIGHLDTSRCASDEVIGDHGALDSKLCVERYFTEVAAVIGNDPNIRGTVEAHCRESAICDGIVGDDDMAGAKGIDPVAVLSASPAVRTNPADPVVDICVPSVAAASRQATIPLLAMSSITLSWITRSVLSPARIAACWQPVRRQPSIRLDDLHRRRPSAGAADTSIRARRALRQALSSMSPVLWRFSGEASSRNSATRMSRASSPIRRSCSRHSIMLRPAAPRRRAHDGSLTGPRIVIRPGASAMAAPLRWRG